MLPTIAVRVRFRCVVADATVGAVRTASASSLTSPVLTEVTDIGGVVHLVSDNSMQAGRVVGRYAALCGCEVLAASLTEPERRHCADCRDRGAAR
jgi:hypothetical protein